MRGLQPPSLPLLPPVLDPSPPPPHFPMCHYCAVNCVVWQELADERDELQSKVTTLENDIAMRDQQLQEHQQKIDRLSQKHKAAVDEGNTLRRQMESLIKLVMS